MNNDKVFISLLSSFLNSNNPVLDEVPDWKYIYNLSNINNVIAIIAHEISLLQDEYKPNKEILSVFKQQLGYTVIEFDKKCRAKEFITKTLSENEIDYMLIKGAVLSDYYPAPEYRTSGDIDVIIKNDSLEKCRQIFDKFLESGTVKYNNTGHQYEISLDYDGYNIEIHTDKDLDNQYFENIFSLSKKSGYESKLNDTNHLAYVICHIAKHFRHYGAGIRMFMDIDVLSRRGDCNIEKVIDICKKSGYEKFAKACLSMCKIWFNSPININYDIRNDERLRELFENEVINAGTFGEANKSGPDYYTISGSTKIRNQKIRGLLYYLFPSINQMSLKYKLLKKHKYLLPVAWIMRIFAGFFKRKKNSMSTVSNIMNPEQNTKDYLELIKELNI